MTPETMDCNELVELVTEYLEHALDPAVRARFEAHLSECDGCENYVEQFRTTIQTLGRVTADRLDPDFRQRLLDTFRGWQPDQR
ncbi:MULTISPECIES: anti-sigma factor family protein [Mycobacterium]|uniref:Zinc-finger family protein n=2 Tax=Mycobacterium TaxID=1763 RepID=X7ZKZ8_MYCKA|nr:MULTISPECIES: zf-HC2 domain-containing protein [Mycobacterium]EUA20252.1 zinc-finger family protein [Mycobacterium kansasii 662]MCQ4361240.1 zf-HC2 domain-containing protein [Mycobacterium gordonae]